VGSGSSPPPQAATNMLNMSKTLSKTNNCLFMVGFSSIGVMLET
jgi:hypothetical protein